MMDPFIGEIRMVGFNFAPYGWAFCNGQILPIVQNTALFSLLGTTYGGDGKTTFGLPNLQGRAPMHWGNGSGLTPRGLGESGGCPSVSLQVTQLPQHNHTPQGIDAGGQTSPEGHVWGTVASGRDRLSIYQSGPPNVPMNALALGSSGNSLPHNNMQPYLAVNFVIAMSGIYPPRS